MNRQVTDSIIMLKANNFGYNHQTSVNNFFQNELNLDRRQIKSRVMKEFDAVVDLLANNGINVIVAEEQEYDVITPDAIFINNWLSFHEDKTIFIYPMYAPNRRLERRSYIIDLIKRNGFIVEDIKDISYYENDSKYLESTGSMVFDRQNKKIYAAISDRTNREILYKFAKYIQYETIEFEAMQMVNLNKKHIYHTNVMFYVGSKFALVCLETITDSLQKKNVIDSLDKDGKKIIEITEKQMNNMLGNVIELTNNKDNFLIMSSKAFNSIIPKQKKILEDLNLSILHSDISTIENIGGGGVRCMIAEIFLPNIFSKKNV